MTDNKRFLLRRRPEGEPVETDFELVSAAIPAPPAGGFVLRNHFASLDPAQRGMMAGRRGDDPDAAVAQPDQMVCDHPPRRPFGRMDGEIGGWGRSRDPRAGQLHLRQPCQQSLIVRQRRHQ